MFRKTLFNSLKTILVVSILFSSCKKDIEESNALIPENTSLPTITTNNVSGITQNDAICGGKISSSGGAPVTRKGVCWSTVPDPKITNSFTNDGAGTSDFTSTITGLFPGTTYYVRAYAVNADGIAYGQEESFTTSALLITGINYAGGIIFYLDSTGQHGLVCADSDLTTTATWGCANVAIPGADGTAIGTGSQNTIDILAACTTSGIAAQICDSLVENNYNDWFLPSKEELKLMYTNLKSAGVGNFSNAPYWSSTEMNSSFAWEVIFNGGLVQGTNKSNSASVRPVRIF